MSIAEPTVARSDCAPLARIYHAAQTPLMFCKTASAAKALLEARGALDATDAQGMVCLCRCRSSLRLTGRHARVHNAQQLGSAPVPGRAQSIGERQFWPEACALCGLHAL